MITGSKRPVLSGLMMGALIGVVTWLFLPQQFALRVAATASVGALFGLFVVMVRRVRL